MKTGRKEKVIDAAPQGGDERQSLKDEDRLAMIAEAAYFRAERRGFRGGADEATRDWLEAEAEIDALLAQGALMRCGPSDNATPQRGARS